MTTSLDTTVLEAVLAGRVVGPQDADWDAARAAWDLAVDQRPSFVVQVATDSDVSEVVRSPGPPGCGSHRRGPVTTPVRSAI